MSDQDLWQRLDQATDEHPPAWRPEPGDTIVGPIVRYDQASTQFGDRQIAVVDTGDGTGPKSVWLVHAVLKGEFERQRPQVGDRIGIKRLDDSAKGYKRYKLVVDRQHEAAPDTQ